MADTTSKGVNNRVPRVDLHVVDDCRDQGKYGERWTFSFALDPSAVASRAVTNGLPRLRAPPFTISSDDVHDHHEYLAFSAASFPVSVHGSIAVSARVEARVSDQAFLHEFAAFIRPSARDRHR